MSALNKETITVLIFLIFVAPKLPIIALWLLNAALNPSPENIGTGVELITQNQIPWWINVIEWLDNILGKLGAFLIICFALFLEWYKE